ncbi:MAG: hypothetical protein JKY60_20690 [Kordiimonadaceae bacterium]|nr:hypothetical protein [Kordiimonadaceae bacterium]
MINEIHELKKLNFVYYNAINENKTYLNTTSLINQLLINHNTNNIEQTKNSKIVENLFKYGMPVYDTNENINKGKQFSKTLVSHTIDESVILENIELALLSILYMFDTKRQTYENIKNSLYDVTKIMFKNNLNQYITNLVNLDCFKTIMLDYGPTHPILNKNNFWNTDIDWDKEYIHEIYNDIELSILNQKPNVIAVLSEWNENPYKDKQTIICIFNLITYIINIIELINMIVNKVSNQSKQVHVYRKSLDLLVKQNTHYKRFRNDIFIEMHIGSTVFLKNYLKKLRKSLLFSLRSIYPTNEYYTLILKQHDKNIETLYNFTENLNKYSQNKRSFESFKKQVDYLIQKNPIFINEINLNVTINHIINVGQGHKDMKLINNTLIHLHMLNKENSNTNKLLSDVKKVWKSAKNQLVHNYLNVVLNTSRDEYYNNKHLQLIELIQEGYIALMSSVDQFESDLGYSFNTYCTFWIHQAIQKTTINITNVTKKTRDNVSTNIQPVNTRLVSSDVPMFSSNSNLISDYLEENIWDNPLNSNVSSLRTIRESFKFLPPSIITLLSMRYGIYPFKKHTLEEVGNLFSVNGETIRYIIRIALKKFEDINKSNGNHLEKWISQIKKNSF